MIVDSFPAECLGQTRVKLALAAFVLAVGCQSDRATDESPRRPEPVAPSAPTPAPAPAAASTPASAAGAAAALVETIDQAVAAKGTFVRLRGIAQREKLGDTITIGDLRVLCVGAELPTASLGKTVEAEGTLNVTARYQATTNANGEVSAGTTPGTKRWVLEKCTPR